MVNDHSNSERGNPLPPHRLLFPIISKDNRQDNTYHGLCYPSHGTLAGTRNSSMGPPCRIDPTTHRTMSERSYHEATYHSPPPPPQWNVQPSLILFLKCQRSKQTRLSPLMAQSSANGLIGTGLASRYQLQPQAGF